MPRKLFARVRETTTTEGTIAYVLAGAVSSHRAFGEVLSDGDTVPYCAVLGADYELGIGTYSSGSDSIARTTIRESSNSNNAVDWAAGTKTIWLAAHPDDLMQPVDSTMGSRGDDAIGYWDDTSKFWKPLEVGEATDTGIANYPIASQAEAEAGTAENRYMNPLRTQQAIAALGESLPVADSTNLVHDPVDATRTMRIDVGAVATSTTRVLTMPDRDVDLSIDGTFAELIHTHTSADVDDFAEAVDDRVSALIVGGTDITVTYDDGAGTLTIDSTASASLTHWTESGGTYSSQSYKAWQPSSGSNVNVIIGPLGTGYLAAHIPDGTSSGGNQRGEYAVDLQTQRSVASSVASGDKSVIAGGFNNTASGPSSIVVGGNSNESSGAAALTGGVSCDADGDYAFAYGNDCHADGDYSFAHGLYANDRSIIGAVAHASGSLSVTGDAQRRVFVLRRTTADGTAKALTTDGNAESTNNIPVLPDNFAYRFTAHIVARKTDGTALACYTIEGMISRGSGAASTTLDWSSVTTEHEDAAGWSAAASADTTNGGLNIDVTGAAATSIRWVAEVHTQEVG